MVKKIKRKVKHGKDTTVGLPMVLLSTAMFGSRRRGRPLPGAWDQPGLLAKFFSDHFNMTITSGDRPIGPRAFENWLGRARWENFGPANWPGGAFPISSSDDDPPSGDDPTLACIPILILSSRRDMDAALNRAGGDWKEIQETSFERWAHGAFNLIPGYDRIVHSPLAPIAAANRGIEILNARTRDEFDRAGLSRPPSFPPFPAETLSRVPRIISLPAPPAFD